MLTAFYDLTCAPPTWDYARFLYRALCERESQQDPVEVVVVPGPREGFRDDTLPPDVATRRQMRDHIVLVYGSLFPNVKTTLAPDRATAAHVWAERHARQARIWPPGYRPDAPKAFYWGPSVHEGLAVLARVGPLPQQVIPAGTLAWAHSLVRGRRCVALVLRECAYWPSRNSDLSAWAAFAAHLRSQGVTPLIVRDTAKAHEAFLDFETVPAASQNLRLLAALTQVVGSSWFVNNGVTALVQYGNPAPYRIFKLMVPGAPCVSQDYFYACGIGQDGRLPWGGPDQRFVWEADTAEALVWTWERREATR